MARFERRWCFLYAFPVIFTVGWAVGCGVGELLQGVIDKKQIGSSEFGLVHSWSVPLHPPHRQLESIHGTSHPKPHTESYGKYGTVRNARSFVGVVWQR